MSQEGTQELLSVARRRREGGRLLAAVSGGYRSQVWQRLELKLLSRCITTVADTVDLWVIAAEAGRGDGHLRPSPALSGGAPGKDDTDSLVAVARLGYAAGRRLAQAGRAYGESAWLRLQERLGAARLAPAAGYYRPVSAEEAKTGELVTAAKGSGR